MDSREHLESETFRFRQCATDERPSNGVFYGKSKTTDSDVYKVGIYGWRKRCLYCLILLLTVVIIVNLAITIWIMRVLDFNLEGMGSLKVMSDGIRVTGKTEFDHPVSFSRMTNLPYMPADEVTAEKPFVVESQAGLALISRAPKTQKLNRNHSAKIVLENNEVKVFCNHFEISDPRGRPLFYANRREVGLRVDNLRVLGDSGATLRNVVQTRALRPDSNGGALVLESPTRGLNVSVATNIDMISRSGDVRLEALHNVHLESTAGEIQFNSPNIFISGPMLAHDSGRGVAKDQFQVCLCSSGGIFLARSSNDCRADAETCA